MVLYTLNDECEWDEVIDDPLSLATGMIVGVSGFCVTKKEYWIGTEDKTIHITDETDTALKAIVYLEANNVSLNIRENEYVSGNFTVLGVYKSKRGSALIQLVQ